MLDKWYYSQAPVHLVGPSFSSPHSVVWIKPVCVYTPFQARGSIPNTRQRIKLLANLPFTRRRNRSRLPRSIIKAQAITCVAEILKSQLKTCSSIMVRWTLQIGTQDGSCPLGDEQPLTVMNTDDVLENVPQVQTKSKPEPCEYIEEYALSCA